MSDSISQLVATWQANSPVGANIAAWRVFPARDAQDAPFLDDVHPVLIESLRARGLTSLYTHQATAWRHARAGKHIVVVTGTASGKTLCYNLPVLDRLLRDEHARALYLFPTKALAQDQVANLKDEGTLRGMKDEKEYSSFIFHPSSFATYDGDTPQHARATIRKSARLVVSNPDMLHAGILPHHTLWAEFFRHLRFVVIDEMHAYRGVFGSHVANVLRRLKRVAAFYGAAPQFILTSATIANPVELAERLIEEPVALVDDDGAPKGEKHFIVYNPPIVDRALGLRRSALLESVARAQELSQRDIQTIVFARSRRAVELILRYLSPSPVGNGGGQGVGVRGYRGGYLPNQRRAIERGLRDGTIRVVVATNALELGIDIGGMGAAILVGYPGTIAATMQQAGRAGRTRDAALAILVASADPLDQFLARHPDYLFGRSPEHARINPDNLLILLAHLRCAAFELPFRIGENFGRVDAARVTEFLEFLQSQNILHQSGEKYFWMADQYPAESISLRSASAESVVLQVGDSVIASREAAKQSPSSDEEIASAQKPRLAMTQQNIIGTVDRASAYWMTHPRAIYLHEGQSFLVDELDLARGVARLRASDAEYYTEPRRETMVQLLAQFAQSEARGAIKAHGEIAVTTQVVGFKKIKWFTHENLGAEPLSLPPTELRTTGYWLALDDATVARLRVEGLWTNAPNDYGPSWNALRDRVRARDRYRCQGCGAPENGRPHHVHHKIPFRAFPSRAQANQLDNLVTLCPNCHRRAELAVRIRSGLAGMAHALGHLAPLFLMCDPRDIGVHSDPESPLASGKPAIVIYDQIPAGIGFSERLFELHDELIARAFELVRDCACDDGCPSCVGPGGEQGYGGKREARELLLSLCRDCVK
ncbi:MAG: DEAD/DEAH box helicase [Chloroflexi bacterium]|nr:DEAD/DEAH box helicase [Chloroflexota bacterium]